MVNLDLQNSKAVDVDHTWYDLRDETQYFHEKTTMLHVKMDGQVWYFNESEDDKNIAFGWRLPTNLALNGRKGLADPKSVEIINEFHQKTQELVGLVENLWWLRKSGWHQHWGSVNDGSETADGGARDYWSNDQWQKYPVRYIQPNYVVPRAVTQLQF
jgi:hypothetical protein